MGRGVKAREWAQSRDFTCQGLLMVLLMDREAGICVSVQGQTFSQPDRQGSRSTDTTQGASGVQTQGYSFGRTYEHMDGGGQEEVQRPRPWLYRPS